MKATNEQIIAEANRRREERGMVGIMLADFIIEVMREGWTPPEPVDPDLLAFREWAWENACARGYSDWASHYQEGLADNHPIAHAFLAGARMATERERERAGPFVEYVRDDAKRPDGVGDRARAILAKYHGET